MLRHGLSWCAATLLIVIAADHAAAWNSIGHMAISKLAYDQLDDGQKARLFAILKSHPHYDLYLAAGRPADISEVEWAIVRCSVWPDWVRPREKDVRGHHVTRYNRPEDHYVNVPLIDPKDQETFAGTTLIDPDVTNIIDALKQRANEMRTKTADPADKAIAACWLFHLIGDIHQPLHNVAYFSTAKDYVKGDLGGNKFGVRVGGQRVKLHAYWDNLLGDDPNYADDTPKHQANIYQEALKIAAGLRDLKLSADNQDKLARNTTFASWSQEGFLLAKTFAYQKSDGSGLIQGVPVSFKGFVPLDAPELGGEYAKEARAIAEASVVLAGQRLVERIKMLLGK